MKTFWVDLTVVMTCLAAQQYKQGKQHDWKQKRRVDHLEVLNISLYATLWKWMKIQFALNMCGTYAAPVSKMQYNDTPQIWMFFTREVTFKEGLLKAPCAALRQL